MGEEGGGEVPSDSELGAPLIIRRERGGEGEQDDGKKKEERFLLRHDCA